jgi:integrase
VETQFAPGSKVRTAPKTPRSKRVVPLPAVTAEALALHMAEYPPGDDGTLFMTRLGTSYRSDYYGTIIKKAVTNSGLPEDTTSHSLRHHYASILIGGGESVVAVAERLGHSTAQTVLQVYAHLLHGSEDKTRSVIDQAWSSSSGLKPGPTRATWNEPPAQSPKTH